MTSTDQQQPSSGAALLEVRDLTVTFGQGRRATQVVTGVDLTVGRGTTLGLVGESGCGKTSVAKAIMGLIRPPSGAVGGRVLLDGTDLLQLPAPRLADVLGRDVAMIFQEPMNSLNPAFTVGDQIAEVVRRHEKVSRRQAWERAVQALDHVRIPQAERRAGDYPHQFSGGMCQRIMTAMAIVCRPRLLIADEPTTALDVTVQSQILQLLKSLQVELGLAMVVITHDLGVVADLCDDVAVMYAGQVVEHNDAVSVFRRPQHPYTSALLGAIPNPLEPAERLASIPGRVPQAGDWPVGCRFAARCAHAVAGRCDVSDVSLVDVVGVPDVVDAAPSGCVRCVRHDELDLPGVLHV